MLVLLYTFIPSLAAYILHLFLYFFGTVIFTSFNILMDYFYFVCKFNVLCVCASPTHFAARGYV